MYITIEAKKPDKSFIQNLNNDHYRSKSSFHIPLTSMKKSYRLESIKHLLRDISAKLLTVNNLINAPINFQINVSYLIYAPSMLFVLGALL